MSFGSGSSTGNPPTGNPSYGAGTPRTGSAIPPSGAGEKGNVVDQAKDKSEQMLDTAKDKGEQVLDAAKEKSQQAAGAVEEKINIGTDKAAGAAQGLADTLREKAESLPGDKPTELAYQAASTIERGADYLRQADAAEMRGDLEGLIRQYPAQSLAVGIALGFLLARAFR